MGAAGVTIDCKGQIGTVTIDNASSNYLDRDVLARLNEAFGDMLAAKTDLRVVLLKARGADFSAGIDYAGFAKMKKAEAGHFAEVGYRLLRSIESLPVPVIAAVKGQTTGAGLGLALAADMRIAAADTVFAFPEAQFGVPPIFGSSQRLYKTIGMGRAKELLFTGRTVHAQEALTIGLINRIVPADMLEEEGERLALKIGGNSLSSLRSIKMLVNFGLHEGYEIGLREEVTAFSEAFNPDTEQWERL